MHTAYDFITVSLFFVMVGYFVFLTDRNTSLLKHFLLSAVLFAVANQLGNGGLDLFAIVLIVAGVGYAWISVRTHKS